MHRIQSNRPNHAMKSAWLFPAALILVTLCAAGLSHQHSAAPQLTAGAPPSTWSRLWRSPGLTLKTLSDEHGVQITETNWGKPLHSYRMWRDDEGSLHESYEEKGVAKPIDDQVRLWIQATLKRAEPPTPPPPPAPPEPPQPPAPPDLDQVAMGQEILKRIQSDAGLVVMVGVPMQAAPTFEGSIHRWGPSKPSESALFSRFSGMDVDVKIPVSGPKGAAVVHAKGRLKHGQWAFSALDAKSSQSGMKLDLLSK